MFGVSGQELFVIALIAIVLLGPERIPVVARGLARAYREFTKMRQHVDTTLGDIKAELKLDELDPDTPSVKPPPGRRVPLDQLHVMDDALAAAANPEPLEVPPEDDYLGV